jgi:hypothetical protein
MKYKYLILKDDLDDRNLKYPEKNLLQCHWSTKNATWIFLGLNPGLHGDRRHREVFS